MVTYDQFLQTCYDLAADPSPGNMAFITRVGNIGYRRAMRYFSRQFEERTKTSYTVAGQQYYQLPIDYSFAKTFKILVGSYSYPTSEVRGQQEWDAMNRLTNISNTRPLNHFIRLNSGIGGDEVGFWPTPSYGDGTQANSDPITIVYEAVPNDIVQAAFTSSTGSLANGSNLLNDSAGTFTPQLLGRYFNLDQPYGDGQFYKVNQYISSTQIGLQNFYEGPTFTNQSYNICDLFGIAEEAQMIPVYYTMWHFYLMRQNPDLAAMYEKLHNTELAKGQENESSKSRDDIIIRNKMNYGQDLDYPPYFPYSITGTN